MFESGFFLVPLSRLHFQEVNNLEVKFKGNTVVQKLNQGSLYPLFSSVFVD